MRGWWVFVLVLVIAACTVDEPRTVAIVGGTAIGEGGREIHDAVVVIRGSRVQRIGTRAETPIPAGSEKVDAAGKYVVGGETGLRAGRTADLVIAANDRGTDVERTMRGGEWVE
ncbi:MAG: hypothetical protein R2729_12345 [Bryobacteraceae bacterium]